MKKTKKDELARYTESPLRIRFTPKVSDLIKAKALEEHTTISEIVRQACMSYFDRTMSDSEIVHASLAENTRKLRYMENKIELLALIVLQQTKELKKVLPNKQIVSDSIVEKEYDKFIAACMHSLKSNHGGILESMILDLYEQGAEEQD